MAKITRRWKNKKKRDYRYNVDAQTYNVSHAPPGFKLSSDRKEYIRVVEPKKLTAQQLQNQSFSRLAYLDKKRAKAERTLRQSKNPKAIKKWQNKVRRIEEKESQYLERVVESGKYQEGFVERIQRITTTINVYVTGEFTDGAHLEFTVPATITYNEGEENTIPHLIESAVFRAIRSSGDNLQYLDTITIDEVEFA